MKKGAIITGDIVDSTKMTAIERDRMLIMLQSLPQLLAPITGIRLEIFRGDSFQIIIEDTKKSLRTAIAIRAHIRSYKFAENNRQWDARLAIGIGTLDYEHDSLAASDGEAYRASGRGLDAIGKARLSIITPWSETNRELKVSTAFADDVVTGWSQSQSRIIFQSLLSNSTHAEIGKTLGVSRQMVDKAIKTGKEDLITLYISRFEEIIEERLTPRIYEYPPFDQTYSIASER